MDSARYIDDFSFLLATMKRTTTALPLPTDPPLSTERPMCVDDNKFCKDWGGMGWCEGKYKEFMKQHCCKTCKGIAIISFKNCHQIWASLIG